jgi:hypothetical protein
VLTALLAPILYSCQDDSLLPNGDAGRPEEGLPATVSLKVCLPAMDVQTRALTDEEENYVGTIWVGIFRSTDGTCVYNNTFDPPTDEASESNKLYTVGKMLQTEFTVEGKELSGKDRIVAVANAERYMGMDPLQKNSWGGVSKQNLGTLLSNVETWSQFLGVKVMRNSTTDITLSTNALLMSGYFAADQPDEYAVGDDIPTVDIFPSDETKHLSGAIYLRRVISYNKFNITPANNVNLTLKTWRVVNIPYCSYVLEEDDNLCTKESNGVNPGLVSHLFNLYEEEEGSDASGSGTSSDYQTNENTRTFEFYLFENKHKAVDYSPMGTDGDYVGIDPDAKTPYDCREREWKNDDGSNSGVYKSLVASNKLEDPENKATYVEITAELDYYYNAKYKDNPDQAEPEEAGASTGQIHRKAEVTYTIHLGYCEGTDNLAKAKDFNCRRNTKYTYNVLIKGVNKIVVEAKSETDEPQPGSEGTVKDMSADPVILDAHYNVFNIELTNKQRTYLSWYMKMPYGDAVYTFDSTISEEGQTVKKGSEFYTWITFRPTSSMDILAKYKDINATPKLDDTNLLTLDDLKNVADHPWTDGTNTDDDPDGTTPHPYTVFIDEYVYHSDPDGTVSDKDGNEFLWGNYVDKDDRQIDLYDDEMYPSSDKQSYYIPSIYSFSQRSIQTHYSEAAQNVTAFGSEHINEVYGLNFWSGTVYGGDDKYKYNGRYRSVNEFRNRSWSNYVQLTKPDVVPYAYNSWNLVEIPSESYPVPMLKENSTSFSPYTAWPNTAGDDKNYSYTPQAACLNRNRDLNGDGIIDGEELRWYIPSSQEYFQFAIGQTELPSPLVQFVDHSRDEFVTGATWTLNDDGYADKRKQLQYHYWTSDNRYFYADEGMSMGNGQWYTGEAQAQTVSYQVRCIRQLGMNPDDIPTDGSKFLYTSSFEKTVDENTGQIFITSTYFTENCVRSYTGSFLSPHDIGTVNSMPPRKFEVAKHVCYNITSDDKQMSVDANGYLNLSKNYNSEVRWKKSCDKNSICSKYTQEDDKSDLGTWRVPNIRELVMMQTEGLTKGEGGDLNRSDKAGGFYLSCTYEYFTCPEWDSYDWHYRFYGKRGDDESIARNMIATSQDTSEINHVKCVRDVDTSNDANSSSASSTSESNANTKRSLVKRSK